MEELITKVKALPEIELLGFMEELAAHIRKNKMEGVIDQVFDFDRDAIDDLEDQVSDLQQELDSERDENFDLRTAIARAIVMIDDIEEGSWDIIQEDLESVKTTLDQ